MPSCRTVPPFLLAGLAACSGGGTSSSPIAGAEVSPHLLACRSRVDHPFQIAEIALRDVRNLGTRRVGDLTGTERGARLHPDGNTVVFARERSNADAQSQEIFTSTLDGSAAEQRLTQNTVRDDAPCWSPDGSRILFVSERAGAGGLWTMARDGSAAAAFVVTPTGSIDGEPDWNAATDRVVWSRRGTDGRHSLWIGNGNGANAMPLTNGGPTIGAGSGDRAPSFSVDGQRVVFVRRFTDQLATLCLCDVATSAVSLLLAPNGDVGMPRIAPTMDRVFFGLAEPLAGRATLRLATIPIAGGTPTLVWPDQRWRLEGLHLLPGLPAAPELGPAVTLDVTQAEMQIAWASSVSASRSQLVAVDGQECTLSTLTFEGREIAGINVKFDLPVIRATDVQELRVRIVAHSTRADGDSVLRSSIYNPLDERFDTVVEMPAATTATTLSFATSSLRHVTAERQLRIMVIADLAPGDRADLLVDLVEVVLVRSPL